MTAAAADQVLVRGAGSIVYTEDGRSLVDLTMGFGAAFLGHANPTVTHHLREQAGQLISPSRNRSGRSARVEVLLSAVLPPGLRPAGLYSTGMEVAELAMRVAATHTGRADFAGFAHSMHGKSAMTAALCWDNAPLKPNNLHVIPFVEDADEDGILGSLASLLRSRRIAALFVEPIQGSNAAHQASAEFYARAIGLCREYGTLCVFDETLTGLYRTGSSFYVNRLAELPDMLLFAKSLGNGFPASALAIGSRLRIGPESLPHSTFSGNALALAAIEGTLLEMGRLPMTSQVSNIEAIVRSTLGMLESRTTTLRGSGAMWCVELAEGLRADRVRKALLDAGVLVSCARRSVRLLPAATIEPEILRKSCAAIASACAAACA